MEATIIYAWTERINNLVHENTQAGGTIPIDRKRVEIALELCETVIRDELTKLKDTGTGL